MMNKYGDTLLKGDKVSYAPKGVKQASPQQGEVLDVDQNGDLARVRWDQTGEDEWVSLSSLSRA